MGRALRSALALAVCLTLSAAAQPARSDSAIEAMTRSLAADLRCPVCQGLSIQDSPSELAQEMRAVIRDQLKAGRSPDEVRQYFVQKYGEWVLLQPKPSGFNLVVYALPVLAVIAGVAIVWRAVRRWTATAVAPAASSAPDHGERRHTD